MASVERDESVEEPLGKCPTCDRMIPRRELLIRYESEDGWPKMFAKCPACEKPVHPQ